MISTVDLNQAENYSKDLDLDRVEQKITNAYLNTIKSSILFLQSLQRFVLCKASNGVCDTFQVCLPKIYFAMKL